jgi:hypothetical protein
MVFGVYLLYQNFLVTFVSISDNLLSLSVMITITRVRRFTFQCQISRTRLVFGRAESRSSSSAPFPRIGGPNTPARTLFI